MLNNLLAGIIFLSCLMYFLRFLIVLGVCIYGYQGYGLKGIAAYFLVFTCFVVWIKVIGIAAFNWLYKRQTWSGTRMNFHYRRPGSSIGPRALAVGIRCQSGNSKS